MHARSARVGIGERESRRAWGQQLVVRGQLHLPMVKLVMRVARVAPKRARCFNSKGTSFHVVLELEHVEPVDKRSATREADAVLPAFARAGQRHDTLKKNDPLTWQPAPSLRRLRRWASFFRPGASVMAS